MLKLYFAPHTCALASHIALEEAGAEFEIVRIDFATADDPTAIAAMQRKVPQAVTACFDLTRPAERCRMVRP
jgi:glutathione S-transferase